MSILQSKLTDHQSLTLPTESQTFPRGQGQGSITSLTIFFLNMYYLMHNAVPWLEYQIDIRHTV